MVMKADFNNPIFQDADKAREWLETELWPDGAVCPHCGSLECSTKVQGKTARAGLYMCNACRKQYTVTVGTLFERSHIPLNKWLYAAYLLMTSKKGISTHQLHRTLGVSLKSTWFMMHRIREALREGKFPGGLGGENKVVEADETYVGGKAKNRKNKVRAKQIVVSLVERGGKVRSRHVADVTGKTLRDAIVTQVNRASYLMTDEAAVYPKIGDEFAGHGSVNHSAEEYVRAYFWHTNTVEGYFSILKRGVVGTYHHVSAAHLHRYLAEFDSRYNERSALGVNDTERFAKAMKGIVGKRLTYRRAGKGAES
jgi:transposase-like protein